MSTTPLRLRELLERLVGAKVRFIEMKRASDRARDHEDVEELEAAQEQGGERS